MKKLKKIVIAVGAGALAALAFVGNTAYASDNTVNINQSPKASVMTGLTIAVGENSAVDPEFYQSRDCRDASRAYMDGENAIMAYETMNVAAAKSKGIECKATFAPEEVAVYTWASFSVCRLNETATPLVESTAFGMSGMHPFKRWSEEFNTKNNASLKVHLYGGSGATMKGLLAKEVEWGFIATAVAKKAANQALITCDYNTDPTSDQYLGKFFDHNLADLRIKVAILAKGSQQEEIKAGLQSEAFTAYLTKYGYSFITYDFDDASMAEWNQAFDVLQSFYE